MVKDDKEIVYSIGLHGKIRKSKLMYMGLGYIHSQENLRMPIWTKMKI